MLVLMILRSLTVLVLVGAVVARPAQKPSERERNALVTLEMNWLAGGIKQADRLSLRFQKGSVDCSLNFFQSEELEKYIKSFGAAEVPAIFDVSYSKSGMMFGLLFSHNYFYPRSTCAPAAISATRHQRVVSRRMTASDSLCPRSIAIFAPSLEKRNLSMRSEVKWVS
jgi:hypothetical protein